MAKLRVTIIDEVRDRRLKVDLPDDAAIEKLLPALAKKLGLPATDPDGQPTAYQLTHEATGQTLGDDQTLVSSGVRKGDVLRLVVAREGEEVLSLWQRVPVWSWVGIVVVVAVIAFLIGQEVKKPVPTPKPTPLPSRVISMPTSTPRPTATPVPSTATPVPTATPRLTPTMDADPTVYDNFNNPAFDGSYSTGLWLQITKMDTTQVIQQDGMLMFFNTIPSTDEGVIIALRNWEWPDFKFFEARMMLSSESSGGAGSIHINAVSSAIPSGGWTEIGLVQYADDRLPIVSVEVGHEGIATREVQYDTWYTARIEFDRDTTSFSYFLNNELIAAYDIPGTSTMELEATIQLHHDSQTTAKAFVDDVRISR